MRFAVSMLSLAVATWAMGWCLVEADWTENIVSPASAAIDISNLLDDTVDEGLTRQNATVCDDKKACCTKEFVCCFDNRYCCVLTSIRRKSFSC